MQVVVSPRRNGTSGNVSREESEGHCFGCGLLVSWKGAFAEPKARELCARMTSLNKRLIKRGLGKIVPQSVAMRKVQRSRHECRRLHIPCM